MFERSEPALKIICLVVAALVLYQVSLLAVRKDPLARLDIPAAIFTAAGSNALASAKGTNALPRQDSQTKATNAPPSIKETNPASRRMNLGSRPGMEDRPSDLPPAVQARVERITQSEILGPVIRPLPMALLGIAGNHAVLRAPNGQTGLVREGEELGGVKLLRLGTNRVLVEHEGQTKELTVFSGFGSETLLPKGKENPK